MEIIKFWFHFGEHMEGWLNFCISWTQKYAFKLNSAVDTIKVLTFIEHVP